jgi:hypothetical protein
LGAKLSATLPKLSSAFCVELRDELAADALDVVAARDEAVVLNAVVLTAVPATSPSRPTTSTAREPVTARQ